MKFWTRGFSRDFGKRFEKLVLDILLSFHPDVKDFDYDDFGIELLSIEVSLKSILMGHDEITEDLEFLREKIDALIGDEALKEALSQHHVVAFEFNARGNWLIIQEKPDDVHLQ